MGKGETNLDYANRIVSELPSDVRPHVSDGYHTFDELYDHRCLLWIFGLKYLKGGLIETGNDQEGDVWRTTKHSDGSEWGGWFLLGCCTEYGKQMTYHLPMKYWAYCNFAETLDQAPEFDGHSSNDVLERIKQLLAT